LYERFLLYVGLKTGVKIAIQATVSKGAVAHNSPLSFENTGHTSPRIIGSDSEMVRRNLTHANCGGPCPPPPAGYEATRVCTICGNGHIDSFQRIK
jgi:hypothetical protein